LLNPLLLYQNYHLVHHLHPIIPFYRYVRVWRRNEDEYLAHDPALSTVGGRELTVEEYRRLRELREHH
jgi:ring-1,2-phenylacetyl-CoA epoxidase subunit PaaE